MFSNYKSYNLTNGEDSMIYLSLITAALLIECIFISAYNYFPEYFGYFYNIIYTQFNLTVVIVDILVMLIAFGITQECYKYLFGKHWNLFYFILIFIIYQLIRNFIYFVIIKQWIPKGYNKLLDINLSYYNKYTLRTLLGDIGIAIILPFIVLYFRNSRTSISFDTIIISVYFICYLLVSISSPVITNPTPSPSSLSSIIIPNPSPTTTNEGNINDILPNELNSNPHYLRHLEYNNFNHK